MHGEQLQYDRFLALLASQLQSLDGQVSRDMSILEVRIAHPGDGQVPLHTPWRLLARCSVYARRVYFCRALARSLTQAFDLGLGHYAFCLARNALPESDQLSQSEFAVSLSSCSYIWSFDRMTD